MFDYTTQKAKKKLGIEDNTKDAQIQSMIKDLGNEIFATTGRAFGGSVTVEEEIHDYSPRVFLDNIDVTSVEEVKIGDDVLEESEYKFNGEGRLRLSSAAGHRATTSDFDEVSVSYTYGVCKIPADLKNAALQLIYQYWNATNAGTPTERRIVSESIGTYRVQYANEGNVDQKTSINDFNSVIRKYTWKLKA